MKIKIKDLLESQDSLVEFCKFPTIHMTESYKVASVLGEVIAHLNLFEKARTQAIDKYADKDELGRPVIKDNLYSFSEENQKMFNDEFNAAREVEVDITDFSLTPEDFKYLDVSPLLLCSLRWLIKEV